MLHHSCYLRYALPLLLLSCSGGSGAVVSTATEVPVESVSSAGKVAADSPAAAFKGYMQQLREYPQLFCKENSEYSASDSAVKQLSSSVDAVAGKAGVLYDALLRFARASKQMALANKAYLYSYRGESRLTPEAAEMAYQQFSMVMLRMFARDVRAFRSHAAWLDADARVESPNHAPRSLAVKQYLSCNGTNGQIVMSSDAAYLLWRKQVGVLESQLFELPESDSEFASYTDPLTRAEVSGSPTELTKAVLALKKDWAAVQKAYDAYLEAWREAYSPIPGYSGSGAPYWCADMLMHIHSHWEELVGWLAYHNALESAEWNEACFTPQISAKYTADFEAAFDRKLRDALTALLKNRYDEEELNSAMANLKRGAGSLYDARVRYAFAGISCYLHGEPRLVAQQKEAARKQIHEQMLEELDLLCRTPLAEKMGIRATREGRDLWRRQMRVLLEGIGNSYRYMDCTEPFSGRKKTDSALADDIYVQRIQDALEETDVAWVQYIRRWSDILCELPSFQEQEEEQIKYRLHTQREKWLQSLYERAYAEE